VWYDNYTNANIIQLPVDEINQLRGSKVSKKNVRLAPRAIVAFEEAVGDQVILNWLIIGSKGNHGCIFGFIMPRIDLCLISGTNFIYLKFLLCIIFSDVDNLVL
jgi:hypothetical protein